jgi:CheY-like chemotaxis protein
VQVAEKEAALQVARYWAQRLGASFETKYVHPPSGLEQLTLSWPRGGQPAILVVDDQEVAIHLFERYLHRVPLRVVGVREPKLALAEARRLRPRAIILDVMMPTQDGWEVLQTLQADPDTSHIPVIICSVWDVPELASAYGAAGFVKKPVNQQDLLEALARLRLLDNSAGSRSADAEEPPPTLAGIGADAS